MLLGYSFLHYRRELKNVKQGFLPTIYKKKVSLEKENLHTVMEKLDGDHLKQFLYEFEEREKKIKTEDSKMKEHQDKLINSQPIEESSFSDNSDDEDTKEKEYSKRDWDQLENNPLLKEIQKKNPSFMED
jgi:hypothetical protein